MNAGAPAWFAVLLAASMGCSSSNDASSGSAGSVASGGTVAAGGAGTAYGAVIGPQDMHCAGKPLGAVDKSACAMAPPPSGGSGMGGAENGGGGAPSGGGGSGGAKDCSLIHDSGYGDTLFNNSGDDDECKYHVTWTSTPVALNQPFTVTVQGTDKATGMPLDRIMGQDVGRVGLSRVEPYVPCDIEHLAPTSDLGAPVTQIGPGTYTVGPLVFDEAGRWVMRFHLYEDCITSPVTPHAHVAFFIDVK